MTTISEKYNLGIYINRLLKQVNPRYELRQSTKQTINNIAIDLTVKLLETSNGIIRLANISTLSSKEIIAGISLIIPGELGEHSRALALKEVLYYDNISKNEKYKHQTIIPPSRIRHIITLCSTVPRQSKSASIAIAAILDYLIAELIDCAILILEKQKKQRITVRHLILAINEDSELKRLVNPKRYIIGGGVPNHIEEEYLPSKNKNKK